MPGHFTFYCNKIENGVALFDEVEAKHAIQRGANFVAHQRKEATFGCVG